MANAAATRHRILVVEDDPGSRMGLVDLLTDHGYLVTWACDGAQALARLEEDRPDLIISDVCMPGTDGFELIRTLRQRADSAHAHVILVSALSDRERRVHGLELGADDFLAKPLDPDELLARVRAQLRRARRHSDAVRLSVVDELTNVLNRRGIFEVIEQTIEQTRGTGRPLSVLVVDIDQFKEINDALGHAAGDEVLKTVAATLRREVRAADAVGRIGGDEFLVVLEGIGARDATAIADRLRTVEGPLGATKVGISVGAATLRPSESADALIERADRAMYERKRGSRGRRLGRRASEPPPLGPTTYGIREK